MRMRLSIACSVLIIVSACGSGGIGATPRGSAAPAGTRATDTPSQRAAIAAAYEASRTAGVRWVTRTKDCIAKARSGHFATPGEAIHCIETAYIGSLVERRLGDLKEKLATSARTLAHGACRTATLRWIATFPRFVQALRLLHAHDADLNRLSSADVKLLGRLARPFNAARSRYLTTC